METLKEASQNVALSNKSHWDMSGMKVMLLSETMTAPNDC